MPGWLSWLCVQLLILAQVMISWFMGLSPASLTVQSLLGIFSLPFPRPLSPPTLSENK